MDSNPRVLQPRDLRKIDSRIPNLVPTILVRKEAILVRCYTTAFEFHSCVANGHILCTIGQRSSHTCACKI